MTPIVAFIIWNRAGLAARNLTALLNTTDDFELYIIDNNSKDDTWAFVEGLDDRRIKSKIRMDYNRGYVYSGNYVLSKRKKGQFFVTIDSDVCINTKNWVTKFTIAMNAFPEAGMLGVRPDIENFLTSLEITPNKITRGNDSYYQQDNVWGGCLCVRPQLLERLGYFNEETGGADFDFWERTLNFTNYKVGYITTIDIDITQSIPCKECLLKNKCRLIKEGTNCFDIYSNGYKHQEFAKELIENEKKYINDIIHRKRELYCASIHDPASMEAHFYNKDKANETFYYFINNSN